MNSYIQAQVTNMVAITKNFEQACDFAAMQDDGIKSRDEEKQLKKIRAATQAFRKALETL